jgi:hypothetical protein
LQSVEASLRTGDVLLFSRAPLGIESHCHSSWLPLRCAIVLLSKIVGRGAHDHAALIIVRNDYPYVLERDWSGRITLRSFEARLLHSSAHEIVLRRLEAPPPTDDEAARVEEWVMKLIGEQQQRESAAASSPKALAAAPAVSAASASSSAAVLNPWRLFRHLAWSALFSAASTTAPARSGPLVALGEVTALWQEAQQLQSRIDALRIKQNEGTAAAAAATMAAKQPQVGGPKVLSSTSTLARLQTRQREVLNRLAHLQRTLDGFADAAAEKAASASAAAEDELLFSDPSSAPVPDSPSAALVARGLQVLGVLPSPQDGPIELRLVHGDVAASAAAAAASPGKPASPPGTLVVRVSAELVPSLSTYAPRHFLSSSHTPLLHLHTLHSEQTAAAANVTAASEIQPTPLLPDVLFHREMFLKVPHKPLPYTVES